MTDAQTRPRSRALSACLLLAVLPLAVAAAVVAHVLNARGTAIAEKSELIVIPDLDEAAGVALTVMLVCWLVVAVGLAVAALLVLRRHPAGRPLATGFAAILVLWPLCCGGLVGASSGQYSDWSAPLRGLAAGSLALNAAVVLVTVAGVLCAYLPRGSL